MRDEVHFGRTIRCGIILPTEDIKIGQIWQSSGGATVCIEAVDGDWVRYSWDGGERTHEKLSFAFQCRYCLVIGV